jgi:metal-dependent amidase/aminoacylase/carboxypeptidase family protein
MLAGVDEFRIAIEGAGGHGGMPHLASDPIVAATALVQTMQDDRYAQQESASGGGAECHQHPRWYLRPT